MSAWRPADAAVAPLIGNARADRWALDAGVFADALERSARKAFPSPPTGDQLERHLDGLHLEDLALACACAQGHAGAWEHFVREYRPAMYRAADALDPSGSARELADSLYGELFGLNERDGRRRSLFDYFHGRSSLATWLRAVLSQRFVDRVRSTRRFEPLPEENGDTAHPAIAPPRTPGSGHAARLRVALAAVIAQLVPKDRLRLACYYVQNLTLAQIGRVLGEHEATVSRNLTRVRRDIRKQVERSLRDNEGMSEAAIAECFESVADDVGDLDVRDLLGAGDEVANASSSATAGMTGPPRKESEHRRSKGRVEGASA